MFVTASVEKPGGEVVMVEVGGARLGITATAVEDIETSLLWP